jgi:hypothetical protein
MTSVALITAVTLSPFFKLSSSVLRFVITDSTMLSPTLIVIRAVTVPNKISMIRLSGDCEHLAAYILLSLFRFFEFVPPKNLSDQILRASSGWPDSLNSGELYAVGTRDEGRPGEAGEFSHDNKNAKCG